MNDVWCIVRQANDTKDPISLSKHQHLAQVQYTCDPNEIYVAPDISPKVSPMKDKGNSLGEQLSSLSIDPDKQLLPSERLAFIQLHDNYATCSPMI